MKRLKKVLVMQLMVLSIFVGFAVVSHAVETDVDVGIEFTEIAGKNKPAPAPKEPIQKIIRLPQTSNKGNEVVTLIGIMMIVVFISLLSLRKMRGEKNEV